MARFRLRAVQLSADRSVGLSGGGGWLRTTEWRESSSHKLTDSSSLPSPSRTGEPRVEPLLGVAWMMQMCMRVATGLGYYSFPCRTLPIEQFLFFSSLMYTAPCVIF